MADGAPQAPRADSEFAAGVFLLFGWLFLSTAIADRARLAFARLESLVALISPLLRPLTTTGYSVTQTCEALSCARESVVEADRESLGHRACQFIVGII